MRERREGDDYRKLQKLGFELEEPQDAFSEQPGSSGRMDGPVGEEEYGIEGGLAEESEKSRDAPEDAVFGLAEEEKMAGLIEDKFGGLSEWTLTHGVPHEEDLDQARGANPPSDAELMNDLKSKLATHSQLDLTDVRLSVSQGIVTAEGSVPTESSRVRIREVLEAIPFVRGFDNRLRVAPH